MKKVVLSIVIILMIVSCKKENGKVQVEYFDNGQIKKEFVCKDGKKILLREYTYYNNGQTKIEDIYKNGNLFLEIKYNKESTINVIAYVNDNKLNGYGYGFFDDGNLNYLSKYVNDKREGLGYVFLPNDDDNELGAAINYKNGEQFSKKRIILREW